MELLPFPTTKEGFIDEKEIFQLAYGTLKLPFDSLDFLTPQELAWLWENHESKQMEHYELISYAFKVAYASVRTGKDLKMFKKSEQQEEQKKLTKEQKQEELDALDNIFKG